MSYYYNNRDEFRPYYSKYNSKLLEKMKINSNPLWEFTKLVESHNNFEKFMFNFVLILIF